MLTHTDYESVSKIYVQGIESGLATFETESPSWEVWNAKHHKNFRFVAEDEDSNKILGWVALLPVSDRNVYRGVSELSIYVSNAHKGKGVGKALMEKMIDNSEANGIWTIQVGIFPENKVSIALHKKFGFVEVGIRRKIGKMNNEWKDVLLMERRSQKIMS